MQNYIGKIILCNQFEFYLEKECGIDITTYIQKHSLKSNDFDIKKEFLRIIVRDEFKIEDAHDVIAEAYFISSQPKKIFIVANLFNHFAQNALLKILEEPPSNIEFILIAKNKTAFLPTIRSRLALEDRREKKIPIPFELDIKTLTLGKIYDFLKSIENENSKEDTKQKIQSLLFSLNQNHIKLNEKELKSFDEALKANQNYQRSVYNFLPLLLIVLRHKNMKISKELNVYSKN